MTKKKKVMSKIIRYTSYGPSSGGSISSPTKAETLHNKYPYFNNKIKLTKHLKTNISNNYILYLMTYSNDKK